MELQPLSFKLYATKKVQKIKRLINTGEYDTDLAKYSPGILDLIFQGMIENTDKKEQVAHISCKDMENLEFQIMLTNNYYTNSKSMHICFPLKLKVHQTRIVTLTDLIPVNHFCYRLIKEIDIIKYENDKQLMSTFLPYEIHQYSNHIFKHLPEKSLKKFKKQCLIATNFLLTTEQH